MGGGVFVAFGGRAGVSTMGQNVGAGAGTRAGERAGIGGGEVEVEGFWVGGEVMTEVEVVLRGVYVFPGRYLGAKDGGGDMIAVLSGSEMLVN